MKLQHRKGDVLTAPAFGHGCNCAGLMGAGVAALVRERFPLAHAEYQRRCKTGKFTLADVHYANENGQHLFNLATQHRPGPDAKLWAIREAVGTALSICKAIGIPELALPWIGCGIGGLPRADVGPMLEAIADYSVVQLVIYDLEVQ